MLSYRCSAGSSRKIRGSYAAAEQICLLLTERHAVGALVDCGVVFMCAYQNPVQGAVVLIVAVMGALMDGALNALVGMIVHNRYPPFCWVLH